LPGKPATMPRKDHSPGFAVTLPHTWLVSEFRLSQPMHGI